MAVQTDVCKNFSGFHERVIGSIWHQHYTPIIIFTKKLCESKLNGPSVYEYTFCGILLKILFSWFEYYTQKII